MIAGSTHQTCPSSTAGAYPEDVCEGLTEVVAPHIESFNFMVARGLAAAVRDMAPVTVHAESGSSLKALDRERKCPSQPHRIYTVEN